jgi:probable F420-dependent oxidoreductase
MRAGLYTVATDMHVPFHLMAQEAEQRGFDIIFTGEHTHIPVGAQVWSGGDLPPVYSHILDPFTVLSAAAATTSKIKLGTSVCLLAIHDSIHFSKLVTSLDYISQGRAVIGLGYGYIDREFENHGIQFSARKEVFRDKLRAIQKLWAHEVAHYEGPYASFKDVQQFPKPFNGERPPIYLGAKLRGETIRDMIEFCNGWLPNAFMGGEHLAQDIGRLKQEWSKAGRDADSLDITVLHTAKSGEKRRADNWGAAPITDEVLDSYERAGVNSICVPLPPMGSRDEISRYFDDYSKRLARLLHA